MGARQGVITGIVAALAALALLATPAVAAEPPAGADWTEEYFESSDGTLLHADVLTPKGLAPGAKTPVLLSVSPYFNHSSQRPPDYHPEADGPSARYFDLMDEWKAFERGYRYVLVDVRGYGGSAGCLDFGGPGERMDAKAAVEWAASQPWSTGKVGILGVSYDGWTSLMAAAARPKGLAAVVAGEPLYSGYRWGYTNGVRFGPAFHTATVPYGSIELLPGTVNDSPQYHANSRPQACYTEHAVQQQQDQEHVGYWAARNLLPALRGSRTPIFLQHGFFDNPDGAFDAFDGLAGFKRAWFGQFGHIRASRRSADGEYLAGRAGFADEAIRVLDHFVRGDGKKPRDAPVYVQDILGRYRAEDEWPPRDVVLRRMALKDGTYIDDGQNYGTGSGTAEATLPRPTAGGAGRGIWTVSQPLAQRVWLAGEPRFRATVAAPPRANVVVNVYDVDPENRATLISRGAALVRAAGEIRFKLLGQDFPVAAGHRIGVVVSSANADWWVHVPTGSQVAVSAASIDLPLLTFDRTEFVDGKAGPALRDYLATAPFTAAIPADSTSTLDAPPLRTRPKSAARADPSRTASQAPTVRLTAKIRRRGRALLVSGRAPEGAFIAVTAREGRRAVASVTTRARNGRYRVRIPRAARVTSIVVRGADQRITRRVRR
jgi:predicted acyl esterase